MPQLYLAVELFLLVLEPACGYFVYAAGADLSNDTKYVMISCTQKKFRLKPNYCDLTHLLNFIRLNKKLQKIL